jgi:hypothetical protein
MSEMRERGGTNGVGFGGDSKGAEGIARVVEVGDVSELRESWRQDRA